MFAENGIENIGRWCWQATSLSYQLDWCWVERYRELASYDGHWWLSLSIFVEE